jgi:hypothetical protein
MISTSKSSKGASTALLVPILRIQIAGVITMITYKARALPPGTDTISTHSKGSNPGFGFKDFPMSLTKKHWIYIRWSVTHGWGGRYNDRA